MAGSVSIGEGRQASEARRAGFAIYGALAVCALLGTGLVAWLTLSETARQAGVKSDTPYDFAYLDAHVRPGLVDRVVLQADVVARMTGHRDRPDDVAITPAVATAANAVFRWVLTTHLSTEQPDAGAPPQLAGVLHYDGSDFLMCAAVIGDAGNYPADGDGVYAEGYRPLGAQGARYRIPRRLSTEAFVQFMREAVADGAHWGGDGALPGHELRAQAGTLIAACTAG